MNKQKIILLILFCICSSACSILKIEVVKAWEKGALSNPAMQWQLNDLDAAYSDHVYSSKEASSGGADSAGGGCGCE